MESVLAAYGARAGEYIDVVGRIDNAAAPDLMLVQRWAHSVEGRVLDVGCGPGQWTHYLAGLGVDVEGLDPVAEFIESAQATYPDERYRIGRAEALGVGDGALGGVFAWYSLIHTDPKQIDAPLDEFARCIRPRGGLVLGFFTGSELAPFEHAVTTAYCWPLDLLASKVEAAGFAVTHTESRADRPGRTLATILATRTVGSQLVRPLRP